ncbi:unnamed protein product [Lactuca saligna]|uniref:Uncharacterized protein n=1 Tax=Lactuca saligna TaxID=75948 RepID=A0AA35YVX2_LACSI|nr:unnamed protein product [Lactuca saligna]
MNLTLVVVEVCIFLKDYLDSVECIQHLASLEDPLAQNVELEIMDEEYAQGLSTPPEEEGDDDEDEEEDEEYDFTSIAESFGRVVVPFVVDQLVVNPSFGKVGILTSALSSISGEPLVEVNGKITIIGISEVDIDWARFDSQRYPQDENSSWDDDGDDNDEDDGEDDISDTIPAGANNVGLEDGEIRSNNVKVVKESNLEDSTSNTSNKSRSPEVRLLSVDIVTQHSFFSIGQSLLKCPTPPHK